jgi:hypothetical protein
MKRHHLIAAATLGLAVGLPLAGSWLRRTPGPRCTLDGLELSDLYRVRVVDAQTRALEFCCIRCAQIWLKRQAQRPRAIQVVDEASGVELSAEEAFFVRSLVVTTPSVGNRIHVFARRADAEKHANQFSGRLLEGTERPFFGAEWTLNSRDEVARYYPGRDVLAELAGCPVEYNILYHNNGDGTFTDVTAKAGLKGIGWGGDIAVFDYNEDGFPDVLITNMFSQAQLYRSNGSGTFTDVTMAVLGRTSWGGMSAKVVEFNNDGKLELHLVDMHSDMWIRPEVGREVVESA